MVTYKNGNYTVLFDERNGSKIRFNKLDSLVPEFPECIDCKISTICNVFCGFCFVPGTKIALYNGEQKNIEDISAGDSVVSHYFDSNTDKQDEVIGVYKNSYNGKIISIEAENGKVISLTPNHKVFTGNGWKTADELKEGDEILEWEK